MRNSPWELQLEKLILRNSFWENNFKKIILRKSSWETHFQKLIFRNTILRNLLLETHIEKHIYCRQNNYFGSKTSSYIKGRMLNIFVIYNLFLLCFPPGLVFQSPCKMAPPQESCHPPTSGTSAAPPSFPSCHVPDACCSRPPAGIQGHAAGGRESDPKTFHVVCFYTANIDTHTSHVCYVEWFSVEKKNTDPVRICDIFRKRSNVYIIVFEKKNRGPLAANLRFLNKKNVLY